MSDPLACSPAELAQYEREAAAYDPREDGDDLTQDPAPLTDERVYE